MNRNTFETVFKVFFVFAGKRLAFDCVVRTRISDEGPDFVAAIRIGEVQLNIITSRDYLDMNLHDFANPSFVALGQQSMLDEYRLLTRKDSEIRSLADLKGKSHGALENVTQWSDFRAGAADFSNSRAGGGRSAQ